MKTWKKPSFKFISEQQLSSLIRISAFSGISCVFMDAR